MKNKKWIALIFMVIAALLLLLLPDSPKAQYYHNQGNIFGTYYNIRYQATEDLHDAIQQRLQDFDHSLSMFNPNSVITHINRNDSITTDPLFEAMYAEYALNPDITRTRMYYEMISEVLPGVKLYVDASDGSTQKLLPLESFVGGGAQ